MVMMYVTEGDNKHICITMTSLAKKLLTETLYDKTKLFKGQHKDLGDTCSNQYSIP